MQVEDQENRIYLPGEPIAISENNFKYNTQSFVKDSQSNLIPLYAGYINKKRINQAKLETSQQLTSITLQSPKILYSPQKGDLVIGVVRVRLPESYILDINGPTDAYLGGLQFDNASKKNKPQLIVGSTLYCRVIEHNKYMGTKLSCVNKGYSNKTSGNELGQLKAGTILYVPQYQFPKIQRKLEVISKFIRFEIAFGKNGIIWLTQLNQSRSDLLMILVNMVQSVQKGLSDNIIQQLGKAIIN